MSSSSRSIVTTRPASLAGIAPVKRAVRRSIAPARVETDTAPADAVAISGSGAATAPPVDPADGGGAGAWACATGLAAAVAAAASRGTRTCLRRTGIRLWLDVPAR